MSKTTLGFIYSGMLYLVIGVTLGVLFFIFPDTMRLRTVHVHLNLVGFVIFLIFGIGYHILPRFRGRPLYSESLAWLQLWMANIGLAGMAVTLSLSAYGLLDDGAAVKALFGGLLAISTYLFIYNMARTLLPAVPKPAAPRPAGTASK